MTNSPASDQHPASNQHRYYPVFLDLHDRRVVIVGGGSVAEEKVEGLLAAGARVTVVAPEVVPAIATLASKGHVEHRPRPWRPEDFDGAFMVFAERVNPAANQAVFDAAETRCVAVNVQDDTPRCSFIAASLLRRGDLTVAISTAGAAPALAVRLRQELEQRLGPHHARFLELARQAREPLLAQTPDFGTRKRLWYRLVDSDVLDRLARGDEPGALARFVQILGVHPAPIAQVQS